MIARDDAGVTQQPRSRRDRAVPQMIAASLAARLTYREGLAFVEGVSDASLPQLALAYMRSERRVRDMADQVGPRIAHAPPCKCGAAAIPACAAAALLIWRGLTAAQVLQHASSGLTCAHEASDLLVRGGIRAAAEQSVRG